MRVRWLGGFVVVIAGLCVCSGAASARGLCKTGSRVKACVSQVTDTGATLEAVFAEEVEYRFELGAVQKCRAKQKCPPWHGKTVATGRSVPGEWIRVDVDDLSPSHQYAFGLATFEEDGELFWGTGELIKFRTRS